MVEIREFLALFHVRKSGSEKIKPVLIHDARVVYDTIVMPLIDTPHHFFGDDHPVVRELVQKYHLPDTDKYEIDEKFRSKKYAVEGNQYPTKKWWNLVAHETSALQARAIEKFGGVLGVPHRRTLYDLDEIKEVMRRHYLDIKVNHMDTELHIFLVPEEYEWAGYPTLQVRKFRPGITAEQLPEDFVSSLQQFNPELANQTREGILERATVLPLDWRIAVIKR